MAAPKSLPVMSAHSSPSSESSGSIWNFLNVIIAVAVGGFAFFWGSAFLVGGWMKSAGVGEEAKAPVTAPAAAAPAAEAAPAAPAAATTTPAATAPAAAVAEITIKPDTANPLAYDTKEFKVKSGQKVKLTFNNTHPAVPQPHNIVIAKAGSKDKLLALAMQMATAPDGMAKGFIPESPDILFHTKLLQPNTSETLEFTAPAAGEYPYICTFPGHGVIMNGVMKVE
jgi:azurin